MPAVTMMATAVRTQMLTTAEAARELNVAEHTLRSWVESELIRTCPAESGFERLIPVEEVELLRAVLPPY